MKYEHYIKLALEESEKSIGQQKIGCVIVNKKGMIISKGYNKPTKSHPEQHKYASKVGKHKKIYLHAEIDALIKCNEPPHTIYIMRKLKDGSYGMAKPCEICEAAIYETTIQKIVYSTYEGIEEWKIKK